MRHALFLCLALSAGAWGDVASAQPVTPGREGGLAALVPPAHGRSACFVRVYDAEHLRAHPRQRVAAIRLSVRYHRHEPDAQSPLGQRNYYFALSARLKGARRPLVSGGECAADGAAVACTQDCDGGGFALRPRGDGVDLDLTAFGRLRMTPSCGGDDASVDLEPGADDRLFRLARAPAAACAGLR